MPLINLSSLDMKENWIDLAIAFLLCKDFGASSMHHDGEIHLGWIMRGQHSSFVLPGFACLQSRFLPSMRKEAEMLLIWRPFLPWKQQLVCHFGLPTPCHEPKDWPMFWQMPDFSCCIWKQNSKKVFLEMVLLRGALLSLRKPFVASKHLATSNLCLFRPSTKWKESGVITFVKEAAHNGLQRICCHLFFHNDNNDASLFFQHIHHHDKSKLKSNCNARLAWSMSCCICVTVTLIWRGDFKCSYNDQARAWIWPATSNVVFPMNEQCFHSQLLIVIHCVFKAFQQQCKGDKQELQQTVLQVAKQHLLSFLGKFLFANFNASLKLLVWVFWLLLLLAILEFVGVFIHCKRTNFDLSAGCWDKTRLCLTTDMMHALRLICWAFGVNPIQLLAHFFVSTDLKRIVFCISILSHSSFPPLFSQVFC